MINALNNQGVPRKLISLIKEIYTDIKARIITERPGWLFAIDRGGEAG